MQILGGSALRVPWALAPTIDCCDGTVFAAADGVGMASDGRPTLATELTGPGVGGRFGARFLRCLGGLEVESSSETEASPSSASPWNEFLGSE